ncbi:MAG: ABC transporter permease [Bacteroidales bacterium]|nr:ABC transporter permease [Bacteroidales bacterium]
MNTELFIASRLIKDKESKKNLSRRIVAIAIFGISLGLAVMIVSVAVLTGFKKEIRNKVIGFGSHIQILNFDSNTSYETTPVSKIQSFYPGLDSINGIKHIQVFAYKPGIIKTKTDIQGIVLKGIDKDFDWSFFEKNIVDGEKFDVNDSSTTNKVLISKYIATLLKLKVGDDFAMYFIQEPPRMRKFQIAGIYETSLEELDKLYLLVDIKHIQKLNGWNPDQVSGFEVILDDYRYLDYMTHFVRSEIGSKLYKDGSMLKVVDIREKYHQIFDWLNLQNMNVKIILILMLFVAGGNMISGLLVLILERTNMIGILKALGGNNSYIRNIFLYQAGFLIIRGLLWGNALGITICLLQKKFSIIKLDQASYFLNEVPINLNIGHLLALNIGTLLCIILMLLLPSLIVGRISPVKTIRYN